jgi:hypothetical protein
VSGFTAASVAAAAIAVDPAALYSVNIGGGGAPYFQDLADATGGHSYIADDPSEAVAQIIQAVTTIQQTTFVDAGGPYSGAIGQAVTFAASVATAPGTNVTGYDWDFNADGTFDVTTTLATASHIYDAAYTGTVTVRVNTDAPATFTATAPVDVQFVPLITEAANYESVVPERLLDTRPDSLKGYSGSKPAAGQVVELAVTGVGQTNVPADASAVVLNVTGVDPMVDGFVTVWPCGEPQPLASNLNLHVGGIAPNLVISKLGTGGKVCLYTSYGAHLVADVNGWFTSGSSGPEVG